MTKKNQGPFQQYVISLILSVKTFVKTWVEDRLKCKVWRRHKSEPECYLYCMCSVVCDYIRGISHLSSSAQLNDPWLCVFSYLLFYLCLSVTGGRWVIWAAVDNLELIWVTTWPFSPFTHCSSCQQAHGSKGQTGLYLMFLRKLSTDKVTKANW